MAAVKNYKNLNNSQTIGPIITKFGTDHRPDTDQTPEVSKTPFVKIQDGRRRKTEIYKKFNNFETVRSICTKFGIYLPLRTLNKPVVPKCQNS